MQIHNRLEALSTKAGRTKSEVAREMLARGLDELPPGP
jgi:predicted DNA-binding protein